MTPQYAGLRTLHEDNKDAGFTVLGFPCNQFAEQEPDPNAVICEFVDTKYDVTFPMFAKIEVNGDGAAPLYELLKSGQPGEGDSPDITWNFTKFLVGRDGAILARFEPGTTPEEIAEVLPDHL